MQDPFYAAMNRVIDGAAGRLTAHGITRTGPAKVSGAHLSEAPNAPTFADIEADADREVRRIVRNLAAEDAEDMRCRREAYVKLLKAHDWNFAMADDHGAYSKGRDSLKQLRMVQREVDADYSIWNAHAPSLHRNGGLAA